MSGFSPILGSKTEERPTLCKPCVNEDSVLRNIRDLRWRDGHVLRVGQNCPFYETIYYIFYISEIKHIVKYRLKISCKLCSIITQSNLQTPLHCTYERVLNGVANSICK